MKLKIIIALLYIVMIQQYGWGQSETYTINRASFSSDKADEFSPVYFKNGIVFCSNGKTISLVDYSTAAGEGIFKINYVDTTGKPNSQKGGLFSANLKTKFNDGPVTFNRTFDTVYYSRNIQIEGKQSTISTTRNKLGIYCAVFNGKKWNNIREFRYNNKFYNAGYNVTTPSLSPDGKLLYFASDMPGGYGGSDLYYCQWKGNDWDKPVNLGPVINTSGNEAYPFINPNGELLFSSDGHPGLGGKDIFWTKFSDDSWLSPVRLDPPVNSEFNDFGIITDSLMNEGYFSSDRGKSLDIFHFKTIIPQIFNCEVQKENKYCFIFNDSGMIDVDTTNLQYKWYFGDGSSKKGSAVSHCYNKKGQYPVKLDIIEKRTGKLFFSKLKYNLELQTIKQPFITSSDFALKDENLTFDGKSTYCPGYKILSYSWDFGDGQRAAGDNVKHAYTKGGEYNVRLGLNLRSDLTGRIERKGVSKKIVIFNTSKEKENLSDKNKLPKSEFSDIRYSSNVDLKTIYSAETELKKDAVFMVELLSSHEKIDISNVIFRKLPKIYPVKEVYYTDSSIYSYIVDKQVSLMATYMAYNEMLKLGFKDVRIRLDEVQDSSEKELLEIIKTYSTLSDSYFDNYERITPYAYVTLDKIVKLMKKYPLLKLEIIVNTDNTLPVMTSQVLTQNRSQNLANYLISRGVNSSRLIVTGLGSAKPITSNYLEKDKKLNRRIEFVILK